MAFSCECGAQHGFEFRSGVEQCRFCGRDREVRRLPLMVVTGAAATGKSTICRVWERDQRVFALDLDVVGNDPFVRRPGNRDYVGLWAFNLRLALEMQLNGLAPLLCGFCFPEQIVGTNLFERFAGLHVLALVCEEGELEQRIRERPGGPAAAAAPPDLFRSLNRHLQEAPLAQASTFTVLDTTGTPPVLTVAAAGAWIEARLAQ